MDRSGASIRAGGVAPIAFFAFLHRSAVIYRISTPLNPGMTEQRKNFSHNCRDTSTACAHQICRGNYPFRISMFEAAVVDEKEKEKKAGLMAGLAQTALSFHLCHCNQHLHYSRRKEGEDAMAALKKWEKNEQSFYIAASVLKINALNLS